MPERSVAYFSMEIALAADIPTYSGGLGILAGDTVRSAADLQIPIVAVSLVYRRGYFRQLIGEDQWQQEESVLWQLDDHLTEMPARAAVTIENRQVHLRAWKYDVEGIGGGTVPVYLLDTDLPENSDWDRTLTHTLYVDDEHYRFCQEVVLGIGGIRMLRALGHFQLRQFHMNEGHSSLLTLELLDEHAEQSGRKQINHKDVEAVRRRCVFTTHTPVPAGHDQFSMDLVTRVLGRRDVYEMKDVFCCEGVLNMTYLALNLSHYVNGVAKRHGLISQHMFAQYVVDAITNGVHAKTWTSMAFSHLFDRHIPGWQTDNYNLRYALSIPDDEIMDAHQHQKAALLEYVNRTTSAALDEEVLTIGFARRMTAYKRPVLLFRNVDRLKEIAESVGRIQLVFAGKAHPHDGPGKELIRTILQMRDRLHDHVKIVFLKDYGMEIGSLITSGVDVWLNTPEPPLEASGTSGMKAALNGVPSLSILDGWWIEGCIEGLTGWSIGEDARNPQQHPDGERDAESLYNKLQHVVIPMFYENRQQFTVIMRHAIALNGSFFNTQRMLGQYVLRAYFS